MSATHPEQERTKRRMRGWKAAALAALLCLAGCHLVLGGTPVYWSDATHAKVIDETTGRPIAGAAVVALWKMGTVLGDGGGAILHAAEAVTDAQGSFRIRPMPLKLRWPLHYLRNDDPLLWIYKPGHHVARLNNADRYTVLGPHSHSPRRTSYWNGKVVPLQPTESAMADAEPFEFMMNEVATSDLDPRRFPRVWSVLIDGYRKLPPVAARELPDPAVSIEQWGRR